MARPIYVRQADRDNEKKVMDLLLARLNRDGSQATPQVVWSYRMSEAMASYDAVLVRNGVDHAIVEIKGRKGLPTDYDEWQIATHKLNECSNAAKTLGLQFFLIFSWSGIPFFANYAKLPPLSTRMSGRYDRNDPADVEEMSMIPRSNFRKI